jgi:hypothetical protein
MGQGSQCLVGACPDDRDLLRGLVVFPDRHDPAAGCESAGRVEPARPRLPGHEQFLGGDRPGQDPSPIAESRLLPAVVRVDPDAFRDAGQGVWSVHYRALWRAAADTR